MAINKIEVNLTVTNLVNELNSGYTWYKKDDLGYGSIEAKYGATPDHITKIRKHPLLKDVDTTITIFNIIDDTKNDNTTSTKESSSRKSDGAIQQPVLEVEQSNSRVDAVQSTSEAADIFASL